MSKNWTGVNLEKEPGYVKIRKNPQKLSVNWAKSPGKIETLEGVIAYNAGDAIITGPSGEKWPVSDERFATAYTPGEGTLPGEDGFYDSKPETHIALKLKNEGYVRIRGGVLKGSAGDWIVQYKTGDYGIIAAGLFEKFYTIL